MFDTRWGFAPHATLLPLNRHSLFHDEFDPGPFITILEIHACSNPSGNYIFRT
jgi:hypothetical protein